MEIHYFIAFHIRKNKAFEKRMIGMSLRYFFSADVPSDR